MSRTDLTASAAALSDAISRDPEDWRAHEEQLRQLIAAHDMMGVNLPSDLRVYADWLAEDDASDAYENLPV